MNVIEPRTAYGFPVLPEKFLAAQKYAAEARERNKKPCTCDLCVERDMLPAVIQITKNWSNK